MSINYGVDQSFINANKTNSLSGLITSNLFFAYDFARPQCYPKYGTTITDLAGNNTGTSNNSVAYDPSNLGSLYFNGSSNYVSIPTFTLGATGAWTAYFWIKKLSNVNMGLMSHWSGGPVNNAMSIHSSGKLSYYYYDGQWNYITSTGSSIANGAWTHIAYTQPSVNTNNMKMYINGALDYSFAPRISWGATNIGSIGCIWGPGEYFYGNISMALLYNSEHSALQVQSQFDIHRKRYGI